MSKKVPLVEVVCDGCGRTFMRHSWRIRARKKEGTVLAFCNPHCWGNYKQQQATGKYKYIRIDGVLITLAHYLWEEANGAILPGFIVHHLNGIVDDNRLENLQAMSARDHRRLHADWLRDDVGKWVAKRCGKCGEMRKLEEFYISRKTGRYSAYCKQCHAIYGQQKRAKAGTVQLPVAAKGH